MSAIPQGSANSIVAALTNWIKATG